MSFFSHGCGLFERQVREDSGQRLSRQELRVEQSVSVASFTLRVEKELSGGMVAFTSEEYWTAESSLRLRRKETVTGIAVGFSGIRTLSCMK